MRHAREVAWYLFFALVFGIVIANFASAQDMPHHSTFSQPSSPNFDQLTIENGDVEGTALLTYGNDAGLSSDAGSFALTAPNGISVQVIIKINVDDEGRERITVLTGDEYAAWPVEADVSDGDEGTIQITRPFS